MTERRALYRAADDTLSLASILDELRINTERLLAQLDECRQERDYWRDEALEARARLAHDALEREAE